MANLAEKLISSPEWDSPENASLRRMVDDIRDSGSVLAETTFETWEQEYTSILEGLKRNFRKPREFELRDSHIWWHDVSAVESTAAHSETARRDAQKDERLEFYSKRADGDAKVALEVDIMMNSAEHPVGTTIMAWSPYPEEAERQFGPGLVASKHYRPDLKRGVMQIYRKASNAVLETLTISLDNGGTSNFRPLFNRFALANGHRPAPESGDDFLAHPIWMNSESIDTLADKVISLHDKNLAKKNGGLPHFHGRLVLSGESVLNFEGAGEDLLRRHLVRQEAIAFAQAISINDVSRSAAQKMLNQLTSGGGYMVRDTNQRRILAEVASMDIGKISEAAASLMSRISLYDTWAAYKLVLDDLHELVEITQSSGGGEFIGGAIAVENNTAMPGCPGSGSVDLFSMDRGSAGALIFGADFRLKRKYKFDRWMYCVKCQPISRLERDDFGRIKDSKIYCGPCGICRSCDYTLSLNAA